MYMLFVCVYKNITETMYLLRIKCIMNNWFTSEQSFSDDVYIGASRFLELLIYRFMYAHTLFMCLEEYYRKACTLRMKFIFNNNRITSEQSAPIILL
jgi:hypothetical protein